MTGPGLRFAIDKPGGCENPVWQTLHVGEPRYLIGADFNAFLSDGPGSFPVMSAGVFSSRVINLRTPVVPTEFLAGKIGFGHRPRHGLRREQNNRTETNHQEEKGFSHFFSFDRNRSDSLGCDDYYILPEVSRNQFSARRQSPPRSRDDGWRNKPVTNPLNH
jgi:hypothetical protein